MSIQNETRARPKERHRAGYLAKPPVDLLPTIDDLLAQGRALLKLHVFPIPIPRDRKTGQPMKGPVLADWPQLRLAPTDLRDRFKSGCNLGILLGTASGNLVQVDPDDPTARRLAANYLPPTGMVSRRISVPCSAYFYRLADDDGFTQLTFLDSQVNGDPKPTKLVEVRGNGCQAMGPPSVHPETGEQVYWESADGWPTEPMLISKVDLFRATGQLAAATLLARRWHKTNRNNISLYFAGWLARRGWSEDDIVKFIAPITAVAEDETNRESEIRRTCRHYEEGKAVAGRKKLREIVGGDVVDKLEEWLELQPEGHSVVIGLEGTDVDNSRLFVERYSDRARYSTGRGWLTWHDTQWRERDESGAVELGKDLIRALIIEAARESNQDLQGSLLKRARDLGRAERLKAMLSLARSDQKVYVDPGDWNRDPFLFNVRNGTLVLRAKSFDFLPHRREDLITRSAPVTYDPGATCPMFDKVLTRILPEKSKREFLQKAIGYALTGDVSEQCFFILWGGGANGKSLIQNLLLRLFGGYGVKTNYDAFLRKRFSGIPNDIARLAGGRLVVATEGPEGQALNEPVVKELTGGDRITARFMRQEFFEFEFTGKIFLATNHRPLIDDPSDAMWRRVRLIDFPVQIPSQEQDRKLLEKLCAELPGVLNWAIEGCIRWQEEGLKPPIEVEDATLAYRAESDKIADFIADCCVRGEKARIAGKGLYEAYKHWEPDKRRLLNKTDFNQRLRRIGFAETRPHNVMTWVGLGLRADEAHNEM